MWYPDPKRYGFDHLRHFPKRSMGEGVPEVQESRLERVSPPLDGGYPAVCGPSLEPELPSDWQVASRKVHVLADLPAQSGPVFVSGAVGPQAWVCAVEKCPRRLHLLG